MGQWHLLDRDNAARQNYNWQVLNLMWLKSQKELLKTEALPLISHEKKNTFASCLLSKNKKCSFAVPSYLVASQQYLPKKIES
jgi:hypothetical protein